MSTGPSISSQQSGATRVELLTNQDDMNIQTNRSKPPLMATERPQSVTLCVDSLDRVEGTPFHFNVACGAPLYKGRMISLEKIIIPRLPNICAYNNIIRMRNANAIFSATIPTAFYNTTTLANTMTSVINAAAAAAGALDTYVVAYDPITRTFSITSTNVIPFYIKDSCNFATHGTNIFPLQKGLYTFPIGSNPAVVGSTVIYSGPTQMIYTRFISVFSRRLTTHAYGNSRKSAPSSGNLIALVDVTGTVEPQDFDVTTQFASGYRTVKTPDAPYINIANSERQFDVTLVDFIFEDEWEQPLDVVYELGSPYSANQAGPVMFFVVNF